MRHLMLSLILLTFMSVASLNVRAAEDPSSVIANCVYSALNDQDKIALKQWFFIIAAADPALKSLTHINSDTKLNIYRTTATIFRRIILNQCANVMLETLRLNDPSYFQTSMQQVATRLSNDFIQSDAITNELSDFSGEMMGVLFELALSGGNSHSNKKTN